jgi:bacterioferritin-associated ferredoxin
MGRQLLPSEIKDCFGCHSTGANPNDNFNPAGLKPGVRCEHCHQGSTAHLLDALQGQFDTAPPKLKNLSAEGVSSFCGQCHRTWEAVIRNRWRGVIDVRFQPYRLANSKCFDGTDPRISCLACHDPHQDVVRNTASYDPKCLACHASSPVQAVSATSTHPIAKACPVAKSDCASCHMPKIDLPGGHVSFTDHEIRIVKAGEPFPN